TRHRAPPCSPLFPYTTLFRSLDPHVDAILRIRPDAEQPILSLRGRYRHSKEQRGHGHKHKGCRLEHMARMSQRLCPAPATLHSRSEEHTSELQSRENLVCRLL